MKAMACCSSFRLLFLWFFLFFCFLSVQPLPVFVFLYFSFSLPVYALFFSADSVFPTLTPSPLFGCFFFLCPPRVSTSVSFPGSFGFPLVPWFVPFSSFSLCIFRSSQAIIAVAAENGAFGAATEEEDKGVPLVFHWCSFFLFVFRFNLFSVIPCFSLLFFFYMFFFTFLLPCAWSFSGFL